MHSTTNQGDNMVAEIQLDVIGNVTADPELRFTPSGAAVVNFTVAQTARMFDKNTNEWKDKDPVFMRCTAWRQHAENIAESVTKGARVMVHGELTQRSYETSEGEKRTVYELQNCEVGVSLQFATAKVHRIARGGAQAGPADSSTPPADDPWGSAPSGGGGQQGFSDEPPFMRAPEAWERGSGLAL